MGLITEISWCDHTANLWWGCVEVAPECDNCYAREWAKRYDRAKWGAHEPRLLVKSVYKDLAKMQRDAARDGAVRSVFVGSMMDIAEKAQPVVDNEGHPLGLTTDHLRAGFFSNIDAGMYPNLLFLFLSKRPQNYSAIVPAHWPTTPPSNVWFGATAGTQKAADANVVALSKLHWAAGRFLSCEPLLEYLTLAKTETGIAIGGVPFIDWVIVGGESGNKARPMHPAWARQIRDQCEAMGVAFHFKQWGEWVTDGNHFSYGRSTLTGHVGINGQFNGKIWGTNPPPALMVRAGKKASGRLLDGRTHDDVPTTGRQPLIAEAVA